LVAQVETVFLVVLAKVLQQAILVFLERLAQQAQAVVVVVVAPAVL
jgi:hypothetical protein